MSRRAGHLVAAAAIVLVASATAPAAVATAGSAAPPAAAPGPPAGPSVGPPATPAPTANPPASPTANLPASPTTGLPDSPTTGLPVSPAAGLPASPATGIPASPAASVPASPAAVPPGGVGPLEPPGPPPVLSAAVLARQAALVAIEDSRISTVRAVANGVGPREVWHRAPYRLRVGGGYTLVLTPRPEPYQVADLLQLAPTTFVAQGPRTYLLTESLYVPSGATLNLADARGLTIRLASDPGGYVSIVSVGGRLGVTGGAAAPVVLTSWNHRVQQPDTDTVDGRAYVRAIAGTATFTYANFQRLGFGSGRTGGVSISGPEREPVSARAAVPEAAGQVRGPAGVTSPVPLIVPDSRYTPRALPYTPAVVRGSRFVGNAFGLFVADAPRVLVASSTIGNSLADGLVLHRGVTDARVSHTVSRRNRGSGFVLSAATSRTTLTGCTAEANSRDGFTVAGDLTAERMPYAASGIAGAGNALISGVARHNVNHGISVDGASDLKVQGNWVVGGDMGIVLRHTANVSVANNQVRETRRHGVAVVAGDGLVLDNVIADVRNGVYVRDAVATVRGNTVTKASTHGIEFVGHTTGSAAAENLLATTGRSALDRTGATGEIELLGNRTVERKPSLTWRDAARRYARPGTVLWALVLLALLVTAVLRPRRVRPGARLPYHRNAPPAVEAVGPRR